MQTKTICSLFGKRLPYSHNEENEINVYLSVLIFLTPLWHYFQFIFSVQLFPATLSCAFVFSPSSFLPLSPSVLRSTQRQETKAEVSPYHRPALALRTSAQRPSLSATGPKAPATTSPTSTVSGSPPSIGRSTRSRRQRRSKQASSCHASVAARSA